MEDGIIVPFEYLRHKDLNPFECLVLALIHYRCDPILQQTTITNIEIAQLLRVNIVSINATISKFFKLGFVQLEVDPLQPNTRIMTYTFDAPFQGGSDIGFIYIMLDTANQYRKLGYSKNPTYRESTLQSEKPSIELVHKFRGTMKQEKECHRILSKYRVRGEWFSPDLPIDTMISIIKKVIAAG